MKAESDIRAVMVEVRRRFLENDADLVRRRAHEQTISQRLAFHLESLLPGWHVNCEYNREGEGYDPKTDSTGAKRRPDIIVHRRGNDRRNLVVIEVKPAWEEPFLIEEDRQKLRRMLPPPRKYAHAFLILYSDHPAVDLYFEEIN